MHKAFLLNVNKLFRNLLVIIIIIADLKKATVLTFGFQIKSDCFLIDR